jgi:hypothetical protein
MASPQIFTVEYDLSQIVAEFEGMTGVIIGNFDKGDTGERLFVSRQTQADNILGRPGPNSDQAYYILYSYLTKSQRCWVVRVVSNAKYGGIVLGSCFNSSLGTADGLTATFTGTLPYERAIPGTVEIWIDKEKKGYDIASTGMFNGTTITSGSVVHETGVVTVTFDDDYLPPSGAIVYARWGFEALSFDDIDGLSADVLNDPTEYDWQSREIEMELAAADTTGVYTDVLPPYPVTSPIDEVTVVGESTVVIYDGTTAIAYADEESLFVDTGSYLDAGATNTINYSTGAIQFTLDATYTPASDLTAKYYSSLSDCAVVYADSVGGWSDNFGITIRDIDIPNNTWNIQGWERIVLNGITDIESVPGDYWQVSREEKVDGFNRALYLEDRINENSYNIMVMDNPTILMEDTVGSMSTMSHLALGRLSTDLVWMTGGDDGSSVAASAYVSALDMFSNKEDIGIDLVVDTLGHPTYQTGIANICDRTRGGRGDCYGVLYTPFSCELATNYIGNLLEYVKYTLNLNTSFCGIYTGHVKISDTYNGRDIWIPPVGFVAAAFSYTADQFDPWWAAAGWRRGVLPVMDVYRKFTLGERDELYDDNINVMRFKPGKGIAIWGQRTLYGINSALRSANVRWLLIVIEKALEEFLESYIFELNDDKTRALIVSAIMSYLETIKLRRGVYAYDVVCDESNNSPNEIDNNRLNVDTYLQPTRVAEKIYNRVVITRTGVDFADVRIV